MYQSYADTDFLPKKNPRQVGDVLDETEIITRFNFVLHQFKLYDLASINWKQPFEEQGIDSLEATALITSLEHEFHIVFEDNVFESFECFNDVKKQICNDHNAF